MHSGLFRDVTELPAAFVAVQIRERAFKVLRSPVSATAANELKVLRRVVVPIPLDVVTDKKIEVTIVVTVKPTGTGAPAVVFTCHTGGLGDVFELAIAKIVKEPVRANRSNEHVDQTIVVKVTDCRTHSVDGRI